MNPEELFEKLINNKISKDEFERLLGGLDDEDTLARYEIYLRQEFEKGVEEYHSGEPEDNAAVHKKLKVTKTYKPGKKQKRQRRNYPIAAVFVLFIGLLFSVLFIISQTKHAADNSQTSKATLIPETISKSTPNGRKFRMTLDDGSFVHLNSASNITYPNKFTEASRDIEVTGEAYFDVQRDENRPFNIKVKDYSVQVLGTSFNIKAYEDEEDFSVTVESGKVKVVLDTEGANTAILEQDQKLIFNPTTNLTEITEVKSTDELSWRAGTLYFDSTPMSKVERIIERWYGVEVKIIGKELRNMPVSGRHKNKNLKAVLEAITFLSRSNYTVKDNSIIIKR
ncbi:MAG: FecR domain-containing protein [Cytophagales bacterium]|nr:FecR domain-containing protein [Cytophagales bacterium]